jgi:hypothetical protein
MKQLRIKELGNRRMLPFVSSALISDYSAQSLRPLRLCG